MHQVTIPDAAAIAVFANTIAAISAAAKEPPALNPNHPNNKIDAPITTSPKWKGPSSFFTALGPI